ncbi:MAG TPA: hypothetical protein ENK61_06825 [Devosia sp.]|nr:hypothetical protein [Devosia sp.]
MTTRLRKPAIFRHFLIGTLLIAFQAYLGYSAINGHFGIQNQKQMLSDIEVLKAQRANLQTQLDTYRHNISLFDPDRLDPDIVSEKARILLSMAHPDDIIINLNSSD